MDKAPVDRRLIPLLRGPDQLGSRQLRNWILLANVLVWVAIFLTIRQHFF